MLLAFRVPEAVRSLKNGITAASDLLGGPGDLFRVTGTALHADRYGRRLAAGIAEGVPAGKLAHGEGWGFPLLPDTNVGRYPARRH